jgi:uncharacterized surface protein with fasciclin (FAS1) repeats
LGGKYIRKYGILVVLLLAVVFISGCAENAQDNKTEPGDEERVTPVEGVTPNVTTPNVTEKVTEQASEDAGEGLMSGKEETSLVERKEVIIQSEEKSGQGNETFSENQTSENNPALIQTAEGAGYSTFASLVRNAGLEDTLNKGGPYTIFVPTDLAFESLPEGMLDDLRSDKEKLEHVLAYHAVNGEYRTSDLQKTKSLISLESGELAVDTTSGGQIMVESATVTGPDIIAGNGVIHEIDKVLIPSEV